MLLFFLYEMFPVPFQPFSVCPFFWLGGKKYTPLYIPPEAALFFFPPCWRLKQKLPPLSKNINCHLSTSFHLISCWVLSASAVTSLRIAGRFSRAHSVEGESGGVRRASLTVHRKWAGNWNRRRGTRALGLINRRLMDVDVVPFLITMGTTKPVISTWPHTVYRLPMISIYIDVNSNIWYVSLN